MLSARLSGDVCLVSAIMIVVISVVPIALAVYYNCAVYMFRILRVSFFPREHEIQCSTEGFIVSKILLGTYKPIYERHPVKSVLAIFHSCTVHLDIIKSFYVSN